jgi:integration host factor subunit beta
VIKSELVAAIRARHSELDRRATEAIVDTVLKTIAGALATGRRVELRGFGAFSVKERPARLGRNPRTGEGVTVKPKRAPAFRTGKEMRKRLASDKDLQPDANI